MKSTALCLVVIGAALGVDARAACYTAYQGNNLVFQSLNSPVDLSRRLGETVPARFGPGATMVISLDSEGCRETRGVAALSDASVAALDGAGARRGSRAQNDARPAANLDRFFNGQNSREGDASTMPSTAAPASPKARR